MQRKTEMEEKVTIISLPKHCNIYLFGSFVYKSNPQDIDLLVVYKKSKIHPSKIRTITKPLIKQLEKTYKLRVDAVYLTEEEEISVNFIKQEGCVRIENIG